MDNRDNSIFCETIENRIFLVRGQKVMLSLHLAELYGIEPRVLVQAVKRNMERFPIDFMFQLSTNEWENLKSHFVISIRGGIRRATPYAFTEQGVAMLSSVLRSPQAVQVNIAIMRVFVQLRRVIETHKELLIKLSDLERRITVHDEQIHSVFEAIRQMMQPPEPPRKKIGFHVREPKPKYSAKWSR